MKQFKRTMSLILAFAMLLSMMPSFGTHVHAEELETEPVVETTAAVEVTTEPQPTTEAPTEKPTETPTEAPTKPSEEPTKPSEVEEIVVSDEETEAPAASGESDALIALRAEIAAYVEALGITPDMPDVMLLYAFGNHATLAEAQASLTKQDEFIEKGKLLSKEEQQILLAEPNTQLCRRYREVAENAYGTAMLAGVTINGVKFSNSGGTFKDNGDGTITATATGKAGCNGGAGESATMTITITNNAGEAGTVSFDITKTAVNSLTDANGQTIDGKYSVTLENGASTTITLKTGANDTKNELVLSNITFTSASASYTVTVEYPNAYGSVTTSVEGTSVDAEGTTTITIPDVSAASGVILTANSSTFLCWVDGDNKLQSYDKVYTVNPSADTSVKAVMTNGNAYFLVDGNLVYGDLNEAANMAKTASNKTIVLMNNGTLPAGDYTIPSGITLLIPYDAAYTVKTTTPATVENTPHVKPTAFRTLTMAANAKITVNGAVSIGGSQNAVQPYNGMVTGPVGFIAMQSGSTISVENGAFLYAWGYITGSGSVEVKSGGTVYEDFQLADFRGGSALSSMNNDFRVFPMSQYYLQNIEVPLKLYAGANENAYMSTNAGRMGIHGCEVPAVGSSSGSAMFKITSGYVIKDYIEGTGRIQFTTDGDITVSAIEMSLNMGLMGSLKVNSTNYNLPIPGHFTINAVSGAVTMDQSLALLPGAEMFIGEGVNGTLAEGRKIILYDWDDWGPYCYNGGQKYIPLQYAPGGLGTVGREKDAMVQLDGTMNASAGAVYTTSGGAAITSTGNGKAVITNGTDRITNQVTQSDTKVTYVDIPINPAWLKNADGTFVDTLIWEDGTYLSCGKHGQWYKEDMGCPGCRGTTWIYWMSPEDEYEEYVEYGSIPNYTGKTPYQQPDENYHYIAGWSCYLDGEALESLPPATQDVVYYTVFTAVPHTWNAGEETTAPGCETEGVMTYTCTADGCGFKKTESVPKLEHNYVGVVTVAATCGAEGLMTYTCKNDASHTYTEPIPATGAHEYTYECDKNCKNCGQLTRPDAVHESDAEFTCVAGKCKYGCGADMPAVADHTFALNANQGEAGYTWAADGSACTAYGRCACGEEATANGTITPAVTTEASCGVMGTTTYTATFSVTWATTQTKDVQDIAAMPHADGDDRNHICDNGCGEIADDGCHGGVADCQKKAVCDECGQSYGELAPDNHTSTEVIYKNPTASGHDVYYACCDALKTAGEAHTLVYTTDDVANTITVNCSEECGYAGKATISVADKSYDGTAAEVTVTKTGDLENVEIAVTYTKDGAAFAGEPKDAGTYIASITVGDKKVSAKFTIAKAEATSGAPGAVLGLVYTGNAQALITAGDAVGGEMQYSLDGETWSETIPTATNAGKYTVYYKVVGDANHNDTEVATVTVEIASKTITADAVNLSETVFTYNGNDQKPAITVTDGEVTLVEGIDYTVTFGEDNENAGEKTVIVTFLGNYSGKVEKTFNIDPKTITSDDVTLSGTYTYTGEEQTVSYTVADGVTYDVTGATGTDAGPYELSITGTGNYTGTVTKTWSIAKADATIIAPAANELTYTGTAQALVTAGTAVGGTVQYKLGDGDWTTEVPTAINAVTYTVSYKVVGDDNHKDTEPASVDVTIGKAAVTVTANSYTVCVDSQLPELKFTTAGLIGEDKLTIVPSLSTEAEMDKVGEYDITITGAAEDGNYTITYVGGKLTVKAHSFDPTTGECSVCQTELAVASVKIGETTTYFETLNEAVTKAGEGTETAPATLTLLADINLGSGYQEITSGVFTLDLNGFELASTNSFYGVLYIRGSNTNITITDGSAKQDGTITGESYGVYAKNSSTVTITGGIITSDYVGVEAEQGSHVDITGGTMTGEFAGVVTAEGCKVEITGGTITGVSNGVYVDSSTVNITGGTITGSYGLYSYDSTVTVTGGTITGGTAVHAYGSTVTISGDNTSITGENTGVISEHGSTVEISGGTITGDTGVHTYKGAVTIIDGTISGESRGACVEEGTMKVTGGSITGGTYGVYADYSGTVEVTGGSITGESRGVHATDSSTAEISGGTITGGSSGVYAYNSIVTIKDGSISGTEYGVYASKSTVEITGGTITATQDGVYAKNSSIVTITGGTITGESYGVYASDSSTVTISGDNTAITGTDYGVYVKNGSEVEITGEDTSITATGTNSCGVYATNSSTVTIEGGTITSENYGVFAARSAVEISGGIITGGTGTISAIQYGVHASSSTVEITGGTITGGSGGVDASSSTVTIKDGSITGGNYGVYALTGSAAEISGGTITGGSGGVYAGSSSTVTIKDGSISGTEYGVYADESTVKITGGEISGTNYDLNNYNSTFTLGLGEEGVGATFPGGITVYGTTLNACLAEGAAYWASNKMLADIADDATAITDQGDIIIKAVCDHVGTEKTYTENEDGTTHTVFCTTCQNTVTATEAHIFDSTDGKCECGHFMAVASVKIGESTTYFETLADAVALADDGTETAPATLTLHADIDLGSGYQEIKSGVFTLDLNGFELAGTNSGYGVLYIRGGNTNITITDGSAEQNGTISGYYGVYAKNSSTVEITGGTITSDKRGVYAYSSTVEVTGGTITATVDYGYGVYASNSSTVTITGEDTSITATGTNSNGVCATQNSTVEIAGGSITGYYGVYAGDSSTVTITGGTITATGNYSYGVYAYSSTVEVTGGTITTTGDYGYGVYATESSTVTITGKDTATSGTNYGVYVEGSSEVKISGGTITGESYGVYASNSSTVTITGEDTAISGNDYGVHVEVDSKVEITGGTITATGEYGNGVYAKNSSKVKITGGTISSAGNGVYTEYSTMTITGGTISNAGCGVNAHESDVTISGGTISGVYNGVSSSSGDMTITGGEIFGTDERATGLYACFSDVTIEDCTITVAGKNTYGVHVVDSTMTINGGKINSDNIDIWNAEESTITLGLGEDGVGATFPGGVSVNKTTLNTVLAEGAAYWQGTKMILPAEGAIEITGGDVVIKAVCDHSTNTSKDYTYVDETGHSVVCSECGVTFTAAHGKLDYVNQGETGHKTYFTCCQTEADAAETVAHTLGTVDTCVCDYKAKAKIVDTYNGDRTVYYATLPEALAAVDSWDIELGLSVSVYAMADYDGDFTVPKDAWFYGEEFTFSGAVTNEYTIASGTFTGAVTNEGYIESGTFNGAVTNFNAIAAGTFEGVVTNKGSIWGGTFAGAVTNNGTINNGTFNNVVTNNYRIDAGTFSGEVNNLWIISSGTFTGAVTNNGTINNGTFNDDVTNNGIIYKGTFTGEVTNEGTIEDGTFNDEVTNNGDIWDGTFNGVVTNNKTIHQGIYNDTLTNNEGGVIENHGTAITIGEGFQYVNAGGTVNGDHAFGDQHKCWCGAVESFNIIFVNGDVTVSSGMQTYGEKLVTPEVTKEGHTFAGWIDENGDTFDTVPAIEDLYLFATWNRNSYAYTVETYTMDKEGNYGEPVVETLSAEYEQVVTLTPVIPEHFTVDSEKSALELTIGTNEDENVLKVYLKRNQYTITFVDTGDAPYAPITMYYGADVAPVADPMKTGYTFQGWDVDVPDTMPGGGLTITAQWQIKTYTVSMSEYHTSVEIASVNGDTEAPFTVEHGQKLEIVLKNTVSQKRDDVCVGAYNVNGSSNPVEAYFNASTTPFTISGENVTGNVVIDAYALVLVTVDMAGGACTNTYFYTIADGVATVVDGWSGVGTNLPMGNHFVKNGHTLAKLVDSEGNVYGAKDGVYLQGDLALTLVWKCDALTHVEATPATCTDTGILEHWICSCGKTYADENGEKELKSVVSPINPEAHAWNETPASYKDITETHHTPVYTCQHDSQHTLDGTPAEHTFESGYCVCGKAATYTVNMFRLSHGVEIASVNGDETAPFTVEHGQNLEILLKNTASQKRGDVNVVIYYVNGRSNFVDEYINASTTPFTISGEEITGNVEIYANALVLVTVDMAGGKCTNNDLFTTKDGIATLKDDMAYMGLSTRFDGYFAKDDHSVAKLVDSEGNVYGAKDGFQLRGDLELTLVWKCDALTHVEATPATCTDTGILEHWICSCGKTYADENGEKELESVVSPINPDAHAYELAGYTDDGETHTEHYICAHNESHTKDVSGVAHDFKNDAHTCVCGAVEKFTVTFYVDGKMYVESQVAFGDAITAPADPTKDKNVCTVYTFTGWAEEIPETMPAENLTFHATFSEGKDHTGKTTTIVGQKDATCTEDGYTGDTVCECGEVIVKGEIIPAKKHDMQLSEEEIPATCVATGKTAVYTCGNGCGHVEGGEEIPVDKSNHTGKNTEGVNAKEETCTEDGYTGDTVCECGEVIVKGEIIPAKKHDMQLSEEEIPATCVATGKTAVYTCGNGCGHVEGGEEIPVDKSNHTGKNTEGVNAKEETCTEDGYTGDTVCECGEVIVKGEIIPAKQHAYAVVSYKDITETHHTAVYVCGNDASHTYDETVEHDYTYDPAAHTCICGAVETFTITWIIDGVETSVEVTFNTLPEAPVAEKAADDAFTYEFKSWDKEIVAATEDTAYTAIFTRTGWLVTEEGAQYLVKDEVQKSGWTEIGDAWYYLDPETGYRAEGVARVPYPTVTVAGNTYAPDQQAIDYAASKGVTFIDEKDGWFLFGEDGKFQSAQTGIGEYLDATRYVENGHIAWHAGMVADGEDHYYFTGDEEIGGNIMATGDVHVSRDNSGFGAVIGSIYTFGEDGKLCNYDGITDMADGTKRYYEGAQLMIGAGLVKIAEGKYIYVRSNGELVVNTEYWVAQVNDNTEINVGMAQFDEDGFMILDVPQTAKTGVYAENNAWVYYVNGDKQYNAGLILLPKGTEWFDAEGKSVKTADGASYVYVRSNAQLATGTYWITKTNDQMAVGKYDFDEFGLIQTQMNGIYYENGGLFFYKDNRILYNAGLIRYTGTSSEGVVYDNNWIYVRSNGQLATGTYWITNTNEEMASGKYEFDADGKMIVAQIADGIHTENGKLYYYVGGVKQVGTGLVQLPNGGYIYVKTTGELAVGDYWVTNTGDTGMSQGLYTFGSDGVMIR